MKSLIEKKEKFYLKKMNIFFKEEYLFILKIALVLFIINMCIFVIDNIQNKFRKNTTVDFIYIGEGNASLIKTKKGKNILIDSGDGGKDRYNSGEKILLPYLLYNKIYKLDEIYITHLDKDHFGGAESIVKKLKVKKVYIPYGYINDENFLKFKKICINKNIEINEVYLGYEKQIEENIHLSVLWPNKEKNNIKIIKKELGGKESKEKNNNSLVIKFNIYERKILFSGDIEKEAEDKISKKYIKNELKSDILLSPHHGSNTSSSDAFLEKVNPEVVIISCGKNNIFKHPSKDVLERYKKRNVRIFRTDYDGLISYKIDINGKLKEYKYKN